MGSTYSRAFERADFPTVRPFLRWAGGKQWLARDLSRALAQILTDGRYFEPFLGGGSLFFASRPASAVLSDSNGRLIELYRAVRDYPVRLRAMLSEWPKTKDHYYHIRSAAFSDPVERAAQFLFLNRLCWNGLFRVNRQGHFNVPYGGETKAGIFETLDLPGAAAILAGASLLACDFDAALADAVPGDVVYLDPPYTVRHSANGFLKYNEKIFSWSDQERLARTAERLADQGCRVIISNADHPSLRSLYSSFWVYEKYRPSLIGAKSSSRVSTRELVFSSVPLGIL